MIKKQKSMHNTETDKNTPWFDLNLIVGEQVTSSAATESRLHRNTPVLLCDALNHMLRTGLYLFGIIIYTRQNLYPFLILK